MSDEDKWYMERCEELDAGDFEVSKWEADFLETILGERPGVFSEKRREVIERMVVEYLD